MATIMVTSAQLRNIASQLRQLNNDYKRKADEFRTQKNQLKGMWDGPAHTVFDQYCERNYNELIDFYNGINQYIQTLENAAAEYERMEAQSAQIAKSH